MRAQCLPVDSPFQMHAFFPALALFRASPPPSRSIAVYLPVLTRHSKGFKQKTASTMGCRRHKYSKIKKRHSVTVAELSREFTRVFACGEDSFALPLTSELDALCGENVNRIPRASASETRCKARVTTPKERKRYPGWDTVFFGGATRI